MGNRSNINLVGNTTFGQNVGSGTGVYKGKNLGNVLQLKTLSVTGTTMTITSDANNIYFSAATGGGGTSYWSQATGYVYPTTSNDNVRLDLGADLYWSGSTACICVNSGCQLYMKNGTSFYAINCNGSHIACTSSSAFSVLSAGNNILLSPNESLGAYIITQTAFRSLYLQPGSSASATQAGSLNLCGGTNGAAGSGGDVSIVGGTSVSGSAGRVIMTNLPAKSSETCGIYIDGSGNLSTGLISGGSGGGSSAGVSGDTQFSDGSSGFVTSNIGTHRQITGGSLIQGLTNTITGTYNCLNEAHGWSNSIENSFYSYTFGYGNCICGGLTFQNYGSFLAGDSNYDQSCSGTNVLLGYGNNAYAGSYVSVALGNGNELCCGGGGASGAVALGDSNQVFDNSSIALGYANIACNYAYAMGYTNDAYGELSVAIGYGNRTCVGAIAAVAIGDEGIVYSGACSAMAHGYRAKAEVKSERVASAGDVTTSCYGGAAIANQGMTREINFFGYTSGATSPISTLVTKHCPAGAGLFYCDFFNLTPRLHALGFNITVTATDLTNNDSAAFFFEGLIKSSGSGGTASFVGVPSKTCYVDAGFGVNADIVANDTDKRLDINVTGETSTCIGWAATLWGTQIRKTNV